MITKHGDVIQEMEKDNAKILLGWRKMLKDTLIYPPNEVPINQKKVYLILKFFE
jgi:hypothetical protein